MIVMPIVASLNIISVVVVAADVAAAHVDVAVVARVLLRLCCDGVKLAFVKGCEH